MTVVSVYSLKGSPGVTTLSCLLASAWPAKGTATVVEADPAGGDLAARFGLSSRSGWVSLRSSARRSEGASVLAPHLQVLPGGVQVLVGSRGEDRCSAVSEEGLTARSGEGAHVGNGVTVVDLGRLSVEDPVSESWLRCSDAAILVLRGDPAGAVHLRDRAAGLIDASSGRLCVVAVGGPYSGRELAGFAGITMFGDIPIDTAAADVASGTSGAGRRLERSLLWTAAGRVAVRVANGVDAGWCDGPESLVLPSPTDVGRGRVGGRIGGGAGGRVGGRIGGGAGGRAGGRVGMGRWGAGLVEPWRRIGTALSVRGPEQLQSDASEQVTAAAAATADAVTMDAGRVMGDR